MRFNVVPTSDFSVAQATKQARLTGVAEDVKGRTAIIYRVSQHAMTSGSSASRWWGIRFSHADKWSNPLMGWVSSADTMAPIVMHLKFESPEQAIQFCIRNGYAYEVNPGATNIRKAGQVDNMYQYNFLSKEVSAQMKVLGARRARAIFANPESGKDAWINLRRTQFGTEPWKPAAYQTDAAWTGKGWPAKKPIHRGEHH